MKTKLTYSQVKEALKAGFVSPLNSNVTNHRVGETFTIGSQEWVIFSSECLGNYKHLCNELSANGKALFWFNARKVLKSKKVSKQTGKFCRFIDSGEYVKVF